MKITEDALQDIVAQSPSRIDLWVKIIRFVEASSMAEIGVYRGEFAARLLKECDSLKIYYMIDPWRHLQDWNKPANKDDSLFEQYLAETRARTEFAAERRVILRGKTTEVIENIPDGSLDFAYIDGDHTLKGVTIDLIRTYPKVRIGGWIGGDDFSKTVWQHSTYFEPTLVFPFAVYFAEAVGASIYALPYSQFLIQKTANQSFMFIDLTRLYKDVNLRNQFQPSTLLKLKLVETFPWMKGISRKARRLINNR